MLLLKNYQENALAVLREYFRLADQKQDADTAFYEITKGQYGKGIPYQAVKELPGLPYICIRLPTGGGKTLLACHSVHIAQTDLLHADKVVVLWLVPSNTIREQTLNALRDHRHPYRQALDTTLGSVKVMDIAEALHLNRATLDTENVIIISTIQAFRVDDTEGRKVYEANGSLMGHFEALPDEALSGMDCYADGNPKPTFANVLWLRSPVVLVDEAHNARTDLSFEMLTRFNPACIIEYTATPAARKNPSNVLYTVSASELYNEDMIRMPIHLTTRSDAKELLSDAIGCRKELEEIAEIERSESGEYLRPVMLIQAQPQSKTKETITYETVKEWLMADFRIPEAQIAISTGQLDELSGTDITDPKSPCRYIITVQKLREGWDCPFAYVLCSLATLKSPTAIEQIVGRVLRMPAAKRKTRKKLNSAYAFAASDNFSLVLNAMSDALVQNGFQRQEAKDLITHDEEQQSQFSFENDPLFSDLTTVEIPEIKPDYLLNLPQDLKEKVTVDEKKGTLTYKGSMSHSEKTVLEKHLPTETGKKAVEQIYEKTRHGSGKQAFKTPSEQGIPFEIPVLSFKQGKIFETYEEQHFCDHEWKLSTCDARLAEAEYSGKRQPGDMGQISVKAGKIVAEYLTHIQNKFRFVFNKSDWTEAHLARWLDLNIPHPDISPDQAAIFLTQALSFLIRERNIPLRHLVQDKYTLRNAIEKKITEHRKNAHRTIHQALLFGEETKVIVSPENCFAFKADPFAYPYNRLYDGTYRFKKHYYPKIGAFGSGEEEECAKFLDTQGAVDFWVRNLERNMSYGFWLQTATDKFYPDFVCRLKDGRNFVVEYKGADRYSNEDSQEKRILGELWAEKSEGNCLFVMTKGKDFGVIQSRLN